MPTEFHRFWSFGYRDIRGADPPGGEMGPKSPGLLGLKMQMLNRHYSTGHFDLKQLKLP